MSLAIGCIISFTIITSGGVGLAIFAIWCRQKNSPNVNQQVYAPDDAPLTPTQIEALRQDSSKHLPIGKALYKEDFLKLDSASRNYPLTEQGSKNVYVDLGYEDPEKMQRKATLAATIVQHIASRNLTSEAAAKLLNVEQATLVAITRGQFRTISESLLTGMAVELSQADISYKRSI
ncbi:MAG: helix-turn-helix domain-containing protein [Gammaproteobacteria bacterium]|nr:helix-turn-helix domain-containing protein [Gammaproteobacteria bacterium]MBU0786590.1 helix-turn-helix domain-containing protein [Gammaproteobacteria bacterium]MBU0814339.1 helix-turn-helix domain-containing protein [Gammaproteobacteria bacterium]MBU1786141.1 helix-turn-helix domain-containing protein [Gammaproteobacteria bacterium]